MILYRGVRTDDGKRVVTVEGGGEPPRALSPRTDVRPHSHEFDWGCGSDAAAQLALALAIDATKDVTRAALVHQALKWQLVKGWPLEGWDITQDELLAVIELLESSPLRQSRTPSPLPAKAPF